MLTEAAAELGEASLTLPPGPWGGRAMWGEEGQDLCHPGLCGCMIRVRQAPL